MIKKSCRICHGKLNPIFSLGNIAVSDFTEDENRATTAPLDFCVCKSCDLVQLGQDVDRDIMYRKYYYKSGLNSSMVKELGEIAKRLKEYVKLEKNDRVLDIGANDGTFLSNFDCFKVGIDPSDVAQSSAKKICDLFVNDYFPSPLLGTMKYKAIASIAMFYDLPDPKDFCKNIKQVLDKDGVWVIQFTDLLSTFKLNAFDNICHEHLEYYSLSVLMDLWNMFDLEVFAIDKSNANGASIRTFVGHKGDHVVEDSVTEYLNEEIAFFQNREKAFLTFKDKMEENRIKLLAFLKENGKGCVLGASTKGNTLLQYYNITNKEIECALEVNSDKYGKRTVVTNIPIVSQEDYMKDHSPLYLLVLPWHFLDFFLEKFKNYLEKGGKIVVPLPEFKVYTK